MQTGLDFIKQLLLFILALFLLPFKALREIFSDPGEKLAAVVNMVRNYTPGRWAFIAFTLVLIFFSQKDWVGYELDLGNQTRFSTGAVTSIYFLFLCGLGLLADLFEFPGRQQLMVTSLLAMVVLYLLTLIWPSSFLVAIMVENDYHTTMAYIVFPILLAARLTLEMLSGYREKSF